MASSTEELQDLFSCLEFAGPYLLAPVGSLPSRVCYVLMKSRRLRKDLYLADTVLHRSWLVHLNPQKLVDIFTASLAPLISASRIRPWLASGWGCRDRRLSMGSLVSLRKKPVLVL